MVLKGGGVEEDTPEQTQTLLSHSHTHGARRYAATPTQATQVKVI